MLNANNCTISTKRLTESGNKYTYANNFTLTNVDAYIEQLDPRQAAIVNGEAVFQTFLLVVEGRPDIIISDLVIDDEGIEYIVDGVMALRQKEIPSHTECFLKKKNA